MPRYEVADAQANLSALIRRALKGEEVIVALDAGLAVRLVPASAPAEARQPGSAKGQIRVAPDFDRTPPDFDEHA